MEILGMDLSVTWMLIIGIVTIVAGYDWWSHHYFQRLGIPVADYVPIFGNLLQWRHGFHQTFADFAKKYGKVFGRQDAVFVKISCSKTLLGGNVTKITAIAKDVAMGVLFFNAWSRGDQAAAVAAMYTGMYEFRKPVLILTDPEIIRKMCIKNFSSFNNRKNLPLCQQPRDKGLTRLKFQEWKEVRNVVMPSFSASKMRLMAPLINDCCDSLVANIDKAQSGGKSVDCREIFGSFAMDASARCGFGLEVDSQKNKDDPLVEHARKAVDFFLYNPARLLCGVFPILRPIFDYFDFGVFDSRAVEFFTALTNDACELRKQEGKSAAQHIDILQLMLNAHNDREEEQTDLAKEGASTRRALTTDEILAQSIIFFFAGYETVSALLIFSAYAMATNPDIQEKLHAEINESAPTRDNLNYDVIFKMAYLDKVVSETLRIYPPGAVFDRFCNETVTYNGLTIEKGVTIMVSVWTIHHNEEYWPNPSKFDPERFSPENKESIQPCTYLPFGAGPRNCAGMRYALLVTKMALVRVMQNFRFEVSPETEIPLALGKVGLAPKNLFVRMVPRK